ncbi:substrate-binding periplasmic protein, partial [Pseudomonas aeruginosa]
TLVLLTENLVPFNMAVNGGNYAKDDGISGISTDTVRAACERAQIECQLILRFPWDRVYQQALSEPGYGVFSTARTPEREDKFKWVGPLAVNDWVLMARGDSSIHLNSLEDAARYRIGGYKNDAISQHLVDRGLQVQLALRDNENVDKLASGQIDLWVTADPSGRYVAQREGLKEVKVVQRFHTAELFLALNKDTPDELVQKLQTAVDALRSEGLLKQIRERY